MLTVINEKTWNREDEISSPEKLLTHGPHLAKLAHENRRYEMHTVQPCSNGPTTNGILPKTDASLWSLQINFFYVLCWQ